MKTILIAATLLLTTSACGPSLWTNVRANGDGTYTMTYVKQGFFRVYGEVYRCTPQGDKLVCQNIDRL